MRASYALCLLFLCVALAGCGSGTAKTSSLPYLPQATPVDPPEGSHMLTANTYAGDALHSMLLSRMDAGNGILVASLVELDDFERSSAFGRLASQQIGSRIGQYGFRVLEARVGATLRMDRKDGEFMLTRDSAKLLADTHDAGSVLLGCYSEAGNTVFVSVRVVRLSDNAIMGAYEYYLPRTAEVRTLLTGSGRGARDGGDSVWRRYALREAAFTPEKARAVPAVPAPTRAIEKDRPAPQAFGPETLDNHGGVHSGGRVIDPTTPPMRFPKGSRR